MKQISFNKKDFDFANILALAKPKQYPKICDFCNNIFEADLSNKFDNHKYDVIKCPICFSQYYVVYNELNGFYYLEFAKSPDDYIVPENYKFSLK